jgi:hypothetical protein
MKYGALLAFLTIAAPARATDLPVPPTPPQTLPAGETAPVPNVAAHAPIAPLLERTTVDVRLYRARTYDPSVGFVPGSRYQTSEERKPIQTPGFVVSVPLR